MKKIIILLLALLMSACSAVKLSETLSSMQTEPTEKTTVTETAAPEKTTEPIPKEIETAIDVPKEETTEPPIVERPKQKPVAEITTATTVEAVVEMELRRQDLGGKIQHTFKRICRRARAAEKENLEAA